MGGGKGLKTLGLRASADDPMRSGGIWRGTGSEEAQHTDRCCLLMAPLDRRSNISPT